MLRIFKATALCSIVQTLLVVACTSEVPGPDLAPLAKIDADGFLEIGQAAVLDGQGSYDPDGEGVSGHHWELVARPPGAQAKMVRSGEVISELTPDEPGAWVVRLTVSDGTVSSAPDVVVLVALAGESCTTDADCENDELWCNGVYVCQNQECRLSATDCDDGDPCSMDVCDEDLHGCRHTQVTEPPDTEGPAGDASCTDGADNDCDGWTDSQDPGCIDCEDHLDCRDDKECTQDRCLNGSCLNTELPDGSACYDGQFCTENDVCSGGVCGGSPRDCSTVEDECNLSECEEQSDVCLQVPRADGVSCDDGRWCTIDDVCSQGVCQGIDRDCTVLAGACQVGICDEAGDACLAQSVVDGILCDDGLFCTVNERCLGGTCGSGLRRDCGAWSSDCAEGTCNENTDACEGSPYPAGQVCVDGLYCTVGDSCNGLGDCLGAARDCSLLDGACSQGICNEALDECEALPANQGQACDDGLFCTQGDTCQEGRCSGGPGTDCEDGDLCTLDSCSEAADACESRLVPLPGAEGPSGDDTCADGQDNDCDGSTDAADVDCVSCINDLHCEDGNPCTLNSCVDTQCTVQMRPNGTACDDGKYCTHPDSCLAGDCSGPPRDCSAIDNDCALGACNEVINACTLHPVNQGAACDDGLFCSVHETCQSGACTGGQGRDCRSLDDECALGLCNDNSDMCERLAHNQGLACEDGFYCTSGETCQDGLCTGGQPRDCSQAADPCNLGGCDDVDDRCIPLPVPDGTGCDDGRFCTLGDACDAGDCMAGPGSPCPQTECKRCQEHSDSCFDPVGTACYYDGFACTHSEACDGSGHCLGVEDDGFCRSQGSPGDLCRPACFGLPTGCGTPPGYLTVECLPERVDLFTPDDRATCSLQTDLPGQLACLQCGAKTGLVILDVSRFDHCEPNGWRPVPGFCYDSVNGCVTSGSTSCCTDFDGMCEVVDGNGWLRTDEADNCGGGFEEWRIEKAFNFSGLHDNEVCFDLAEVRANSSQAVLVHVHGQGHASESIFCLSGEPRVGADGIFYRQCALLPDWTANEPDVRLQFIAHSDAWEREMRVDNIVVRGWAYGCSPARQTVLEEDFSGCPLVLPQVWNGWIVAGTVGCVTGFLCHDSEERLEADATSGSLERTVDASGLDGDVQLCFHYGDDGRSNDKHLEVAYNAGAGWKVVRDEIGDPGQNQTCHPICVNLSELDPAVNRNPNLGLRFALTASDDQIYLDHVTLSGAVFCDASGILNLGPLTAQGGQSFTCPAENVAGIPATAEITCHWDSPPAGQELRATTRVQFLDALSAWAYRRKISLDNIGQSEDLADFPVMLRLAPDWFDTTHTEAQGADLRFVDADLTTLLDYEIESWNDDSTSVVWVRVPHIRANSSDDHIWMYYGNDSATAGARQAAVWDRFFQAVWHLAEASGNTLFDASAKGNDGTYINNPGRLMPGAYGDPAVDFNGTNQYVDLGGLDVVGAAGNDGITLEVVALPEVGVDGENRLIAKSDGMDVNAHYWMLSTTAGGSRLRVHLKPEDQQTQNLVASSAVVTTGDWFYAAATYDGVDLQIFLNGQPFDSVALAGPVAVDSGTPVWIAANPTGGDEAWDGRIGEVRLSNIGRTPGWIAAQYRNMLGSFAVFGSEETR